MVLFAADTKMIVSFVSTAEGSAKFAVVPSVYITLRLLLAMVGLRREIMNVYLVFSLNGTSGVRISV